MTGFELKSLIFEAAVLPSCAPTDVVVSCSYYFLPRKDEKTEERNLR